MVVMEITPDKKLAAIYRKNWQEHTQHSEVYVGRRQQK
jgi:hypothetical protein